MAVSLGRNLALTHKAVHECVDARMAEHGSSLAIWLVLHHAVEAPDLSQTHLAARLFIEAPTLVRHIDRLEAEGLIERRRDERDRRVVRVRVTEAGRETEARLRAVADAMNVELMGQLGTDQAVFERALDRIREYSLTSLAERKHDAHTS